MKVTGSISQLGVSSSITQLDVVGTIDQLGVSSSISEGGYVAVPVGTAPVFISATVENAQPTKVVITYDQALLTTSTPATTDFTVTASTINTVLVSGTTVTLTLAAAVIYGDVKNLTYTAGTNPVKGNVGSISAANLGSTAITNNVAAEAEFNTLIAREGTASTTALRRLINLTIKGLKDDGVFALGDCLYVRGVHESQLACQNWIKNDHNSTLVNSPTFTAKEGFTGDGVTMHINNNYKPYSQADKFTLAKATVAIMCKNIGTINGRYFLGYSKASAPVGGTSIKLLTLGFETCEINSLGTQNNNVTIINEDYLTYVKTDNSIQGYKNGSPSGAADTVTTDSQLTDYTISEMALTNTGTGGVALRLDCQKSFSFYGAELTPIQVSALYTRIKYFYDNVGGTF